MSFLIIPSLRWRLVTVMVVADLIVAVATGIVNYSSQRENLQAQLVARAKSNAAILAAGAIPSLRAHRRGALDTLQNFVFSLKAAEGISSAAVYDSEGCLAASTSGPVPRVHSRPCH